MPCWRKTTPSHDEYFRKLETGFCNRITTSIFPGPEILQLRCWWGKCGALFLDFDFDICAGTVSGQGNNGEQLPVLLPRIPPNFKLLIPQFHTREEDPASGGFFAEW